MKLSKIREALNSKTPLVWNDPDPIEGNDYTINLIADMPSKEECNDLEGEDWILTIQYGGGSEAEVYPSEISLK